MSEELEDLHSLLMTVNPRYRPIVTGMMMDHWYKEDWKAFQITYEDLMP